MLHCTVLFSVRYTNVLLAKVYPDTSSCVLAIWDTETNPGGLEDGPKSFFLLSGPVSANHNQWMSPGLNIFPSTSLGTSDNLESHHPISHWLNSIFQPFTTLLARRLTLFKQTHAFLHSQ